MAIQEYSKRLNEKRVDVIKEEVRFPFKWKEFCHLFAQCRVYDSYSFMKVTTMECTSYLLHFCRRYSAFNEILQPPLV